MTPYKLAILPLLAAWSTCCGMASAAPGLTSIRRSSNEPQLQPAPASKRDGEKVHNYYFWKDDKPVPSDVALESQSMGAGSWVMAVAASVAQSDPKKLKEIMKQVPNSERPGEFKVDVEMQLHDPTGLEQKTVTQWDAKNSTLGWELWKDALWPKILAQGMQSFAVEHRNDQNYPIDEDMSEGKAAVAYTMIYGHSTKMMVKKLDDANLEILLSSDRPRVAWLGADGTEGKPDPFWVNEAGLNLGQYWTIMSFDKATKKIQVRNPWGIIARESAALPNADDDDGSVTFGGECSGASTSIKDGQLADRNKGDGVIEIDIKFFRDNFMSITGAWDKQPVEYKTTPVEPEAPTSTTPPPASTDADA